LRKDTNFTLNKLYNEGKRRGVYKTFDDLVRKLIEHEDAYLEENDGISLGLVGMMKRELEKYGFKD
jgi:hypothetical protein